MHRVTPHATAARSYTGGGGRALIESVDDAPLMQAMKGQGMAGEAFSPSKDGSFPGPESPQNYGFTSVVADAKKVGEKLVQCAEGFMSFMGGNRTFPVMGIMDDRRHRLKNLAKDAAKGATAMFGLKEWGQQFLNTEDGMFMTGNTQKKIRYQLVDNQNGQTQQQTQQQAASKSLRRLPNGKLAPIIKKSKSGVEFEIEVIPFDASGGGGGGSGGGGGGNGSSGQPDSGQPTGQKTLHKEDSTTYRDMTAGSIHDVNGSSNHECTPAKATGYYKDNETASYKADAGHAHIKGHGAHVWVDGVPKKSAPFVIQPDPCK